MIATENDLGRPVGPSFNKIIPEQKMDKESKKFNLVFCGRQSNVIKLSPQHYSALSGLLLFFWQPPGFTRS
jgi:hypothetical protein